MVNESYEKLLQEDSYTPENKAAERESPGSRELTGDGDSRVSGMEFHFTELGKNLDRLADCGSYFRCTIWPADYGGEAKMRALPDQPQQIL